LALAGISAGADGLIVDVHDDPAHALVDGPQALLPEDFEKLMNSLKRVSVALDRTFPTAKPDKPERMAS
jgi:3-deoxy-7-phosphoheptulonate synthase